MTTIECILLSGTIFIFTLFIFKKNTYSIIYPVVMLMLFSAACTVNDITSRKANEIIVYNTPGSSSIGLKTGKILNLYSDTIVPPIEVLRHCATLGLKLKVNTLTKNTTCIKAGGNKIMLSNILYNKDLTTFEPDIIILTGLHPEIENNIYPSKLNTQLIVTSKASSGFHLPQQTSHTESDKIYLVKKSGAFIERFK